MSLLNSIIGAVAGSVLGGKGGNSQQQNLAMQLIAALLQNSGGAGNLLNKLQQSGLAGALAAWISDGANAQSVDGNQITSALGGDLIGNIAQKVGVDSSTASNLLAQYLPLVIDKMTPNGTAEDAKGFDLSDGLDLGDIAALASKFLSK
ncbi:MAG: YidB family protein [Neisseria sp.]|nr:YidB family protein [Neisseria sp.]